MAVVGGGTAVGQGALLVAAPLLARLYDPSAFGLLAAYAAVVSVVVAVASLRFDMAIPTADDVDEAVHLVILCLALAVFTSASLALLVFVSREALLAMLGASAAVEVLWLVPLGVLVASLLQALSQWAVYERSYANLAGTRATQGVGQAGSQVSLGLVMGGPVALVAGDVIGRMIGLAALVRLFAVARRSVRISYREAWSYAGRRWPFARLMAPASLLNMLSLHLPFLGIPVLFDLESSGQFFLAYRILVLPASLLAAAVGQVFLAEAALRRADRGRLHDLALNATVTLLAVSIPIYLVAMVGGQAVVESVFGPEWSLAGTFTQIMAPSLILSTAASPIASLLLIGRRERESLAFTALELVLRGGAVLVGAAAHSLVLGVALLSAVSVLLGVASLWRFLRVASVALSELVPPSARIILLTVPSIVLVLAVGLVERSLVPHASVAAVALALGLATTRSREARSLFRASGG